MATGTSRGNALPHGTTLLWYSVETVLGQGAFGITYLAEDTNLHRWIAIKEFLPGQLARRREDGTVEALNDEQAEEFIAGRQRFIDEARTLARFEHPNIVRVHNVFEANGTAYMVMQYEEGEGLDRLLERRGTLGEEDLLRILHPLLDGLDAIHALGFLHRDIKPANIFIRHDGTPVLLDFGSAREADSGNARPLTSFVSPGYAPIEQYAGKSDSQGPWTDIYGLGATLYRAMTGRPPTDAVERSHELANQSRDGYQTPVTEEPYSAAFVEAVDRALRFRASERPQNIAAWRSILPPPPPGAGAASEATTQVAAPATPAARPVAAGHPPDRQRSRTLAIAALVAVVAAGLWFARRGGEAPEPEPETPATPATAESAMAAADPAPATAAAATAVAPEAGADPGQARIEQLLYDARLDLEALRLTSPAGNNALEKYREVLSLDPDNDAALRGIEAIADRYVGLAYRDIQKQNLARAGSYLDKAATLQPKRASVTQARGALEAARTAAATAGSTAKVVPDDSGDKLQKNFDDFVNEQKRTQRPATRGDELIKRLGGGS